MVLIEIINNSSSKDINYLIFLQMQQAQYKIPDMILFNPYVVTLSIGLGLIFLDEFFNYLFWGMIKPYRNRIREKIKCKLKSLIKRDMKS